jgi:hypothetical protein
VLVWPPQKHFRNRGSMIERSSSDFLLFLQTMQTALPLAVAGMHSLHWQALASLHRFKSRHIFYIQVSGMRMGINCFG